MEVFELAKHEESAPPLIEYISQDEVSGFDSIDSSRGSGYHPITSSSMVCFVIHSSSSLCKRSSKFSLILDEMLVGLCEIFYTGKKLDKKSSNLE